MSSDQKSLQTSSRYIYQEARKKILATDNGDKIMEINNVKSVSKSLINTQHILTTSWDFLAPGLQSVCEPVWKAEPSTFPVLLVCLGETPPPLYKQIPSYRYGAALMKASEFLILTSPSQSLNPVLSRNQNGIVQFGSQPPKKIPSVDVLNYIGCGQQKIPKI